jgi:hypothetical protein
MNDLQAAIEALELLAAGKPVPRTSALIAATLELDTLAASQGDRDLRDAATGLQTVVSGGTLDLDEGGRARAAALADRVRRCRQSFTPT